MKKLDPRWRNFWGINLLCIFCYLAAADIYPALLPGEGRTLSEFMHVHPLIILPLGYLMGHFWPIGAVLKRIWEKPE